MHFLMHAFNNHVMVLHSVTPLDLLAQVAVLFFNSPNVAFEKSLRLKH